jgi:hypothetical protein
MVEEKEEEVVERMRAGYEAVNADHRIDPDAYTPEAGSDRAEALKAAGLSEWLPRPPGGLPSLIPGVEGLHADDLPVPEPVEPGSLYEIEFYAASSPMYVPAAKGQDAIVPEVVEVRACEFIRFPSPPHVVHAFAHRVDAAEASAFNQGGKSHPLDLGMQELVEVVAPVGEGAIERIEAGAHDLDVLLRHQTRIVAPRGRRGNPVKHVEYGGEPVPHGEPGGSVAIEVIDDGGSS